MIIVGYLGVSKTSFISSHDARDNELVGMISLAILEVRVRKEDKWFWRQREGLASSSSLTDGGGEWWFLFT